MTEDNNDLMFSEIHEIISLPHGSVDIPTGQGVAPAKMYIHRVWRMGKRVQS